MYTYIYPGCAPGHHSSFYHFKVNKKNNHFVVGLRKVRDDQKTHKNKDLRKTGPVPDKPKPAVVSAPKAQPVKKPPVCHLQGKKWLVVCTTPELKNRNYVF